MCSCYLHFLCTCVLSFCLCCRFGISRRGPFTHLSFWHFFFYSGEEHFTFISVQSLAGRLVVIKVIFFLTFNQVFTVFFKKPQQSLVNWTRTVSCYISMTTMHDVWHFLSASAMFCTFMVRHKSTCMESSASVLFLLENRISQHPALASGGQWYSWCLEEINKSWYNSFQQYTSTMHPW